MRAVVLIRSSYRSLPTMRARGPLGRDPWCRHPRKSPPRCQARDAPWSGDSADACPFPFDTRLGTDGSRPTASAPTLTGVSSHEPLFPDQPRTDKLPIYAHESHYGFLQRVKDPVFERVRSVLNEWFERFAEAQEVAAVKDLRNRLRGKGKGQFSPAFWELYLHELFARLGFDAQVHPASGRGTKPDFLLTGNGTRFYLEADSMKEASGLVGSCARIGSDSGRREQRREGDQPALWQQTSSTLAAIPALPDHGPGTGRTLGRRNDCRLSCPFRLRPSLRTNGR